jgi:hypothetical protein
MTAISADVTLDYSKTWLSICANDQSPPRGFLNRLRPASLGRVLNTCGHAGGLRLRRITPCNSELLIEGYSAEAAARALDAIEAPDCA